MVGFLADYLSFYNNSFKNIKVELIVDHKRLEKVDWEH